MISAILLMTGVTACSSEKETDVKKNTDIVLAITQEPEASADDEKDESVVYPYEQFDTSEVEGKKLICITVDDGPDGSGTKGYIDFSVSENVPLTFFVIGNKIESNKDQLKEMLEAGCEIGNHSYSHSYLTKESVEEIKGEISMTDELIAANTDGAKVNFVRAPYFSYNDDVYNNVGYPLIDAAIQESGNDYEATLEVLLNAKDGDIMLMHTWNTASLQALTEAAPILKEQGFAFVTVSQLFKARGYEAVPGSAYRNVGINLANEYNVTENLFTGENKASGDWNNWETAVELSVDKIKAMKEGDAVKVEYQSSMAPCIIMQSWSDGPSWIQMTPSSDNGQSAVFTYEDMLAAYGEDFASLDAVLVRPFGADLTATSVDMMTKK